MRAGLPRGVWILGGVSLLMDTASELTHSLLPVFMTTVLGASMVSVGVVEGIAEATASIVKVWSGAMSDRWRRRKPLVVAGYAMAALAKPAFPLASSLPWVLGARFVDRVGKGIRGAPRDALVADLTPPALRGAAYGLRQSLDSIGAVAGPLLAIALMTSLDNDLRAVLWFSVAPALAAVGLLAFVREPEVPDHHGEGPAMRFAEFNALPRAYWVVVALGMTFTLARFSEAFLVLRAQDVGLPVATVPAVMVVMSAVYAGGAYPAGLVADRAGARVLLVTGLAVLVVADLMLAAASSPALVFAGAACWGLHMAFTQGLFAKMVADQAPARVRGSAFGLFNLACGVSLLAASVIAGALWNTGGPEATFVAGALFAALALAGLIGSSGGSTRA